jgi:hypothetical protein
MVHCHSGLLEVCQGKIEWRIHCGEGVIPEKFIPLVTFGGSVIVVLVVVVAFGGVFPGDFVAVKFGEFKLE